MESPYSIHNMVQHGLLRDMLPGEWYGPQTVAHVLREVVVEHEKRTGRVALAVLVSDDGSIYLDEVYKLCASEGVPPPNDPSAGGNVSATGHILAAAAAAGSDSGLLGPPGAAKEGADPQLPALDGVAGTSSSGGASGSTEGKSDVFFDPLLHLTPEEAARSRMESQPWKQSLLILIPVRLGLGAINPCYAEGESWH